MVIDVDPCDMAKFCDQLITHFRVENDRFSDVPRELDPGAGSVRMLATWPARRGVFPVQFRIGNDQGVVDLDGHISDAVVADALKNIMAKQADVKFLGSYPTVGNGSSEVRADANAAWRSAEDWLASIRSQIND